MSTDGLITLTYGGGGKFDPLVLVEHVRKSGRDYIVQGQRKAPLSGHSKPHSLDYWLRQYAHNPDTKQADDTVMTALVNTGLFRIENGLQCSDSGRKVFFL